MTTAGDLLRSVGLAADGLALLGRPVSSSRPGVYLVELAEPRPTAPIELTTIGKWIERVPSLQLDGARPSSRALRARLEAFWIPSTTVLFVGVAERTVAGRVRALVEQVLGDPRPHPAGQWLRTLSVTGLRVRWVETGAAEEYEDALLDAFAAAVPEDERQRLHDTSVVLPYANLRRGTGERKATGITGSTLPLDRPAPAPPTRVVDVPAGDAEGARVEERGSGVRRRTNVAPPASRASPPARTGASRSGSRSTSRSTPPAAEPLRLTADGRDRIQAELDELMRVRRPEVVDRIRRARELGDLRENAEYHAAREEQSFLEGRIQALEGRLRSAVVVDAGGDGAAASGATIGSTVRVETGGDELELTLVGPAESAPAAGRISDASPVGRALIGSRAGDEVTVRTPRGDVVYRVLAVE
ncbi:MAG TPA: transcription elongation factor GreA [Candidatus Limnocylindrales bacterium]|nr:transcription elongation factor GreA [Candidatus Limnocylindrales bacterium]